MTSCRTSTGLISDWRTLPLHGVAKSCIPELAYPELDDDKDEIRNVDCDDHLMRAGS